MCVRVLRTDRGSMARSTELGLNRFMLLGGGLVLALFLSPGDEVRGQGRSTPDSRAQSCANDQEALQDSGLGVEERWRLLWGLHACGDLTGQLLAEELGRLGGRSDLPTMNVILNSIMARRDPRILEAALDLMSDQDATIEGRVAALRLFVEYHHHSTSTSFSDYGLPWEPRPGARVCGNSFHTHGGWTDIRPLPEDWRSTVRDRVTLLEDDETTPDPVRWAAHCTLLLMKLEPPSG